MTPSHWKRSSHCAEGNACVYVATGPAGHVLVADSGEPGGRVLALTPVAWGSLVGWLKAKRG
ncbi:MULTISPECIES: DUF397 domain-containing protein [Streptomyces]|uniref:DUF397 domain-containing protein n=1 Tax=Streptomyces TaxID=1883 RepID=UPI000F3A9046|nr:DUF397 domain-containing protein [Streptomyces sp. ADI95-16]AYV28357.1 hypothetical protein EES41_16665 [Streptomyces sp. ADI95-16]